MVYTISLRMLKNPEDAEELAQDIFVKVYSSLKEFKFESKLLLITSWKSSEKTLNDISIISFLQLILILVTEICTGCIEKTEEISRLSINLYE